jgi:hypothetical protein
MDTNENDEVQRFEWRQMKVVRSTFGLRPMRLHSTIVESLNITINTNH